MNTMYSSPDMMLGLFFIGLFSVVCIVVLVTAILTEDE